MYQFTCAVCGRASHSTQPTTRYCPGECRAKGYSTPSLAKELGISSSDVGALNELRVCADLMAQGFYVYRALSPAAPFDLMVLSRSGIVFSVEVKTAYDRPGGTYTTRINQSGFDHLACVFLDRIVYQPPLPEG